MQFMKSYCLIVLLILVGCKQADSSRDENELSATYESILKSYPVPTALASEATSNQRPANPEAFRDEFLRQFPIDFYKCFIDLGYWDGADDQNVSEYLKGVLRSITLPPNPAPGEIRNADADVKMLSLGEYGDYGYYLKEKTLTPDVTHVLEVRVHVGSSIPVTQVYAVGQHDGKYFFCRAAN